MAEIRQDPFEIIITEVGKDFSEGTCMKFKSLPKQILILVRTILKKLLILLKS